jgi:hypothetical protein
MSQPTYESLVETIQKLTQDLNDIEGQLDALQEEEVNQEDPRRYVVLQQQIDHLDQKKRALQDAWNRAMTELALYRSNQPTTQETRAADPGGRNPAQPTVQTDEEEEPPSARATALVLGAIRAWEERDTSSLASSLSDDLTCERMLPQRAGKAQLLDVMNALMTAFPDWSFNARVPNAEPLAERGWNILIATVVTGTQGGSLVLPGLAEIPATGRKIALPYRHLEFLVSGDSVLAISADFSPNLVEEVLAQLGIKLP